MTVRKAIQIGYAVVLGLAMFIPTAHADVRNQLTEFTFSKPIQVSDSMTLPAGTYWFRLADSVSQPNNTVEIFDKDGKHITNVETEVSDRAAPAGTPSSERKDSKTKLDLAQGPGHDTLIKWYYAGDSEGHKFTYSAEMQKTISREPVVSVVIPDSHHVAPTNLSANQEN